MNYAFSLWITWLLFAKGSDELEFLCHMTAILTSVHHSIELHRHADTACAIGGEVQGRVLPGFCEKDNHNVETVTYYGVLFSMETTRCFSITSPALTVYTLNKLNATQDHNTLRTETTSENMNSAFLWSHLYTEKQFACSIR